MRIPIPSSVSWIALCALGGDLAIQCNVNKSNGKSCIASTCPVGHCTHPDRPGRLSPEGDFQHQPWPDTGLIQRCEIAECGAILMLYPGLTSVVLPSGRIYTDVSIRHGQNLRMWTSPGTWTVLNCGFEFVGSQGLGPGRARRRASQLCGYRQGQPRYRVSNFVLKVHVRVLLMNWIGFWSMLPEKRRRLP
jgi:hypothetical protein